MKIAVTGTRGIPNIMGGVETHCENLFPRIASMGADVVVIRRKNYAQDSLTEWKGVRIIDIPSPKKKALEAIVHTFRAVNKAKSMGADILHIHAIGPALVTPYAKLRGLKVVFTHHGPDYDRDKWGLVAKTMLKLGERLGCRYADHVIVISNVIKKLIADKYGRTEGVSLVYNGVPVPDVCRYEEYFTELGIQPGRYILGMCRFVPEKRLDDLVCAFSRLKEQGRIAADMRLVLAGDTDFEDDYSRSLKKQAAEAGVVLTGFIKGKKLSSLLSNCALYVLPSSHEGLPIALLEAMSYGAKVVVSDIPANLEVGLAAECYFSCADVQSLEDCIVKALETGHGKTVYEMSKYDWDHIAAQVMEIYTAL